MLALAALAACRDTSRFSTNGDRFQGPVVQGSFVRAGLRYWQCGDCARQTSLISGTMFEASKLNRTPFGGRHEATMSVSHGRPVRSLATNREPAVGG